MADQGVHLIGDIINCDGTFKKWQDMNINIRCFLDWMSVVHAVPRGWINILKKYTGNVLHFRQMNNLEPRLIIRDKVQLVATLKSNQVYLTFIEAKVCAPISQLKWNNVFHNDDEVIDWNRSYSVIYRTTIDAKMREFQFKLIHNILPVNHKLYRWKLIASDRCSLCHLYPETVEHLFMSCLHSVNLYFDLVQWLAASGVTLPKPRTKEVIFGIPIHSVENTLVNLILLIYKIVIFQTKDKEEPSITLIKTRLKMIEEIENRIAYKRNKLCLHHSKWNKILPLLR